MAGTSAQNKALPYPLSENPYSSYILGQKGIPSFSWRTGIQALRSAFRYKMQNLA